MSLRSPRGRDFSPALRGEPLGEWEDEVFYEFENVRSIRTLKWKYVERLGEAPERELYDLESDPDERHNLADHDAREPVIDALQQRLHQWFAQYADPKWDLWNGGASKSRIGTMKQITSGIRRRDSPSGSSP